MSGRKRPARSEGKSAGRDAGKSEGSGEKPNDGDIPFGSLAHYESATEEIYRRDYGDLVQIRAGQREFLTFRLGDELYAVDLRGILEVTRPTAITPVPFSPSWVLGVMMLRGNVVPIFHVGRMLDLDVEGRIEPAERILLVSRKENPVGLLVDEVREVVSVPDESLGPVPPTVHGPRAEFVTGVARKGNELFVLLNHARVANVSPGTGTGMST